MYSTTGFEASNFVSTFNAAFDLILWISIIFIIGLTVIMLYFAFKYNSKKHKKADQIEGSTALEITWTVIPILLALLMFYYGWSGWTPMNKVPKDALNVTTVARMWSFTFMYDNGKQSQELVIPVSTPVNLKLTSLDVLHSVYIPEFRIKSDIVPGREKNMWFQSDRQGEYNLFCSEYCGLRHSYMNANVRVVTKDEYDKWLGASAKVDSAGSSSPGAAGEAVIKNNGCVACHSTDGSKIVGPSFKGLFGSEVNVIRDGQNVTVTADEQYIIRSIYEPDADVVQGFQKGLMQSYKATISEDDVAKIVEFLKSLNGK